VVGGLHFVYPGKDHPVTDNIVGNIPAVLDNRVIANIAGDDGTVPDSGGDAEIVVRQEGLPQNPQPDKAVKTGISDEAGIKGLGDQKIVPIGTVIPVFDQNFYFMGFQPAPGGGFSCLPVPKPVFVFSRGKVFGGYKIITVPVRGHDKNFSHV
jgi:hypothetical protein